MEDDSYLSRGTSEVFEVEELSEVHGLIERGPNWYSIENITITINPVVRQMMAA